MTDQRTTHEPDSKTDDSVTEESGAGYGNNAQTGGTEAPGEADDER